jgi:hypothetical protein
MKSVVNTVTTVIKDVCFFERLFGHVKSTPVAARSSIYSPVSAASALAPKYTSIRLLDFYWTYGVLRLIHICSALQPRIIHRHTPSTPSRLPNGIPMQYISTLSDHLFSLGSVVRVEYCRKVMGQ